MLLLVGHFYPGSSAELVDWKPTRSPEVEAQNEIDDVRQMLDAQNEMRRRRGAPRWTRACGEVEEEELAGCAGRPLRAGLRRRLGAGADRRLRLPRVACWARLLAEADGRCAAPVAARPAWRRSPRPGSSRRSPTRTAWDRARLVGDVAVVHWLLGSAEGAEERWRRIHGERWRACLKLGDEAPDFEADTTEGRIRFHDWIGDSWAVLFSHPKDFTPVCTTELGYMASIEPEFAKRDVKIIGLSVDPLDRHEEWASDIEETQGTAPNYPIISDADFKVSKLYGMLPAEVSGDPGDRTPVDNQTVRNVFVIGPDKKVKLILVYPMTTGRNFDEVLRVIDSLQLTAKHKVATPAQWQQGDDVIIGGSVSNDEAKEIYPDGWEEPRPYIRIVPQPI